MQLNPLEILCADFLLYRVLDTTRNRGMFNSQPTNQPTNLQLNFILAQSPLSGVLYDRQICFSTQHVCPIPDLIPFEL
jgi:hypothetical protein